MPLQSPIPVVDVFAGPGGLSEGFSQVRRKGQSAFRIALSVEKDPIAHKTLQLRSVFRALHGSRSIKHYYNFIAGQLSRSDFMENPEVAAAFRSARDEALCIELGTTKTTELDKKMSVAIGEARHWVLVGGPPCQAYSLAGRARRANDLTFHADVRHSLYTEYLRIIRRHRPSVFVMENVKGLLSSSHAGAPTFAKILGDLGSPGRDLSYDIRSFVKRPKDGQLVAKDYVIEAERFGIPQNRHRVILLGVRSDLAEVHSQLLTPKDMRTVRDAIGTMPKIRSRLSRAPDSQEAWQEALASGLALFEGWTGDAEAMATQAQETIHRSRALVSSGHPFIRRRQRASETTTRLDRWLLDDQIGGVCQHESRSHMATDLARYLFAATFAKLHGRSPRLNVFPPHLQPDHRNAGEHGDVMPHFSDRFRVQCPDEPATTIVSHISKDGHYYIHYDGTQCRSLTVREAARLQTFPDNYFFEGTRTQQYVQIGNAVPPLLAHQLANVVLSLVHDIELNERANL